MKVIALFDIVVFTSIWLMTCFGFWCRQKAFLYLFVLWLKNSDASKVCSDGTNSYIRVRSIQLEYVVATGDVESAIRILKSYRGYGGSIGDTQDTEDLVAIHRIQRIRWRYGDTEDPLAIRGYRQSRDPAIRFFPLY